MSILPFCIRRHACISSSQSAQHISFPCHAILLLHCSASSVKPLFRLLLSSLDSTFLSTKRRYNFKSLRRVHDIAESGRKNQGIRIEIRVYRPATYRISNKTLGNLPSTQPLLSFGKSSVPHQFLHSRRSSHNPPHGEKFHDQYRAKLKTNNYSFGCNGHVRTSTQKRLSGQNS